MVALVGWMVAHLLVAHLLVAHLLVAHLLVAHLLVAHLVVAHLLLAQIVAKLIVFHPPTTIPFHNRWVVIYLQKSTFLLHGARGMRVEQSG